MFFLLIIIIIIQQRLKQSYYLKQCSPYLTNLVVFIRLLWSLPLSFCKLTLRSSNNDTWFLLKFDFLVYWSVSRDRIFRCTCIDITHFVKHGSKTRGEFVLRIILYVIRFWTFEFMGPILLTNRYYTLIINYSRYTSLSSFNCDNSNVAEWSRVEPMKESLNV